MRNIYRIRRFITSASCQHLTRSLILSRLDYAYSLLYGITSKDRKILQTLQNRAARIVFRLDRRQPSAPLLRELHWLPLKSRVIFKLMLLTFRASMDFFQATWASFWSPMFHLDRIYVLVTTAHFSLHLALNGLLVINLLLMLPSPLELFTHPHSSVSIHQHRRHWRLTFFLPAYSPPPASRLLFILVVWCVFRLYLKLLLYNKFLRVYLCILVC